MTVYIKKPALNLREELASLRNQGGYQEQQFHFDSLVTNGTFDTDTNWTKGTGWTIAAGVASADASAVSSTDLLQTITTVAGERYVIVWKLVSRSGGSVRARVAGIAVSSTETAAGVYSFYFTANSTTTSLGVQDPVGSFVGSVDNISVFKVDASNDVIHTMPKGWKPKDFYEDGLLQREGAANDYEVIYDGFDYVIKPTVAPSATTQTCVIGVKA